MKNLIFTILLVGNLLSCNNHIHTLTHYDAYRIAKKVAGFGCLGGATTNGIMTSLYAHDLYTNPGQRTPYIIIPAIACAGLTVGLGWASKKLFTNTSEDTSRHSPNCKFEKN